jgi:MerR family transcriptional regulator, light-induced transcriptional regulator
MPIEATIRGIQSHSETLAETIVTRQYTRQAQLWQPYGPPGREKSVRDVGYHLAYLTEALAADEPALFCEYLAWVKALFAGLKLPEDALAITLEITRQVIIERLPPDQAQPAVDLLDIGLKSLAMAPAAPESFLTSGNPLSPLAHRYLAALVNGDRHAASEMVLQAVQAGQPVKDLYLHIFQPVQRELGRLWQTNQISIAQEHFCTAATQMIMSQLYPYIFTGERKDRRLVATCVGGELHEIGARMVADFFEMAGWDTYFLGANTPPESILRIVDERRAHLLALSATMTFHISKVTDLITTIRQSSVAQPRILVGGYPFNLSPTLWRRVGADGFAPGADTALAEAERVLAA